MIAPRESADARARRVASVFLIRLAPYTVLLVLGWIFGGRELDTGSTLLRLDLLTFIYPGGAALTGAIFGALQPLAVRSRALAMFVGIVAITPWMIGVDLAIQRGYTHWTGMHTFMAGFTSLVFGSALGLGFARKLAEPTDVM